MFDISIGNKNCKKRGKYFTVRFLQNFFEWAYKPNSLLAQFI